MAALNLHDAILEEIHTDWKIGTTCLSIKDSGSNKILIANQVAAIECPRRQPWGPSIYINSALLSETKDSNKTLTMEMQSGDVIRIEAQTFSVTEKIGN